MPEQPRSTRDSSLTPGKLLSIALEAAQAGAGVIREAAPRVRDIVWREKGATDFVSEVDLAAEMRILDVVRRHVPHAAILAEETSSTISPERQGAGVVFVVDPLDGTTNFLHGLPHWSISIALEKDKEIVAAVIHDPIKNELFHAEKGGGAFSSSKRLRVSGRTSLVDGLIGVGDKFFNTSFTFPSGMGVRRMGSACLSLAYVAAGRLDAYWEEGLSPWDKAAGSLIVREAGGYVSEIDGGKNFVYGRGVLAANPALHADLLQKFQQGTTQDSVKAKTAP